MKLASFLKVFKYVLKLNQELKGENEREIILKNVQK